MAIIKCKMCGGDIEFTPGATYGTCEYCGSTSTIPKADDENKLNRYNRANHFRRQCEFDKAVAAYEKLLEQDDTDAEAHWGAVLSRYGIEYVEDPATKKRIPTCHRVQMASILADADYKAAVEHAPDAESRRLYEEQAAQIAEIQKGILAVSANEKPYDVFICYKETDEIGQRTHDSQWAQDVYYGLTEQGYKVFFARITLEDKLGQQYEPYIFAALNSAKVMLVVGTKPEYFNAVWVKNEWSRYLSLMKQDRTRLLIPCYRGMDPYDLPEELSALQSQDMSKIGFMQDLIRGISKVLTTEKPQQATSAAAPAGVAVPVSTAAPLLRRAFMFLEDGDWEKADEFCEQVLNLEPENAEAYLGKLMVQLRVTARKALADCSHESNITKSSNYEKACRFDKKLAAELQGYIDAIKARNEARRIADIYANACDEMKRARNEGDYKDAAKQFESIADHKDSAKLAQECREKAEISRKDEIYRSAGNNMRGDNANSWEYASRLFKSIPGWKDADAKVAECENKIAELKAQDEARRQEKERQAQLAREKAAKEAKLKKQIAMVTSAVAAVIVAVALLVNNVIIPNQKYNAAVALVEIGQYEQAIAAFAEIGTYKDSEAQIEACEATILERDYQAATVLLNEGKYYEAYVTFNALAGYKDSNTQSAAILKANPSVRYQGAEVGDYITFGVYEQDANYNNGKEPLEWLVLAKENNGLLVISRYVLDVKSYNEENQSVTWGKCTLRTWLNHNFVTMAFTREEQGMIPTVTVSADKNPVYDTDPGNATQDKVFLLSVSEATKYFTTNSNRQCAPTPHAIVEKAYIANGSSMWFLRSTGSKQEYAVFVRSDGDIDTYGYANNAKYMGVRPAMWISLDP